MQQQGNNNFDSSEHYNLNNDEAYLYHSMIEQIPMEMQNDPSLHTPVYQDPIPVCQDLVPVYQEPVPAYMELERTQHLIDSNALQTATTSVNLCAAQPEQNVHVPENADFVVPPPPKKHKKRRRRRSSSEDRSSERSFHEAVEDLLGPFDDEASRLSRPIPEYDHWSGSYKFDLFLPAEENGPDGVSVTKYSEVRNTLYVKKDQSFMVTFSTVGVVPDGTKISVMGMFTQQDHVSEIVKRCDRHTITDYEKGFKSPDHLIRCDSNQVLYLKDTVSGRRHLIVPYENPQRIEHYYVTYPFKFICSGNCVGGLNGRPFRVIFALENGGIIIGRQSVEIKICEDPHKEITTDNKKTAITTTIVQARPEPERNKVVLNEKKRKYHLLEDCIKKNSSEEEGSGTKSFQIMIPNKEMYEFLALALQQYRLMRNLEKHSSEIMKYLTDYQKKKKKKE